MKVIFFEKVKLFWIIFWWKRLERTHRGDKLFITHLIKSVYQILLAWMRTFSLKSTISSQNPLLDDIVRFLYINVYFYLTQNYDHYLLLFELRKLQKYRRKSYLNMCIFGLWMYNSHFYEMPLLWSILTILTIETPKNSDAKNYSSLL